MSTLATVAAGTALRARAVGGRSAALDAVKGLLVLAMILYHWLNYFVMREGEIYRYLRFITPSFVFIAGFLLTSVHLARYGEGAADVGGRLFARGVKLVALFTGLNVLANVVLQANYNGSELGLSRFLEAAPSIYLAGDARGAAFEVLLPIGYLLALAPVLLRACRRSRLMLPVAWLLGVTAAYVLKELDLASVNVELLSHGLLGMMIGGVGLPAADRATRPVLAWLAAYALYLVPLNIFDVRYEVQVAGLILNLALLYILGIRLGDTHAVARTIILLGRYSLFAYIAHIAILQLLARALTPLGRESAALVLALTLATLATVATVGFTETLRRRAALLDRLYRAVFA